MEKSDFQFTSRGLLWATFWVALSMGASSLYAELLGLGEAIRIGNTLLMPEFPPCVRLTMYICGIVAFCAPLFAVGSLVKHRAVWWAGGFVVLLWLLVIFLPVVFP